MDAVLLALVALLDAALDVPVYDGPRPTSAADPAYVLVGTDGTADAQGVSVELGLSDIGPGDWTDHAGEVTCSVWSVSGDTDMAATRAAAQNLLDACRAAIAANPTLGGLLEVGGLAQVTRAELQQIQTGDGALARITFTVAYATTA